MSFKPALPNMAQAVSAWAQKLEFVYVGKFQNEFLTQESYVPKKAFGTRAPLTAQQLALKPEGERAWKWEIIHSTPSLILTPDDIIVFGNGKYRVMAKRDYSEYGYVEYEIMQDYTTTW